MLLDNLSALESDTARFQDSIGGLHQQLTISGNLATTLNDSIDNLHQALTACNNQHNILQDSITTLNRIVVEWIEITDDLLDSITWLRQLLANCQTGTSNAPINVEHQIQIFPNPVTNQLHITNDWQSGDVVELFDMNGHRVFSAQPNNSQFNIDMSPFQPGTYILRITQQGNKISVKRIVKM